MPDFDGADIQDAVQRQEPEGVDRRRDRHRVAPAPGQDPCGEIGRRLLPPSEVHARHDIEYAPSRCAVVAHEKGMRSASTRCQLREPDAPQRRGRSLPVFECEQDIDLSASLCGGLRVLTAQEAPTHLPVSYTHLRAHETDSYLV